MSTPSILREGANCWRIAHASRLSVLVDAADYFAAFRDAVAQAKDQVWIVGWDINSKTKLVRDGRRDRLPDELGPFIESVLKRRPTLEVYVSIWNFAMIYALEREWLPLFSRYSGKHPRLHYISDGVHPVGASHHQKIVVVDESVAFCGGLDLTHSRWDTSEHRPHDPRRVDPGDKPYGPFHDIQVMLAGEAASALADIARERWRRAGGEVPPAPRPRTDPLPWPADFPPDVEDIPVGIARTEPEYNGNPEVREVERLYLDSIAAAQQSIYLENQYLTSDTIAAALAERLAEPDGPEEVLLVPEHCSGWLEETTMGVLRGRVLVRLREADRWERLRVFYPCMPEHERLVVHSKVMIVDDGFLRIGSSNLSNRSMGLDTECDIALEAAGREDVRRFIVALRERLLAEQLSEEPARVAAAIERLGSLGRAVDELCGRDRTLSHLCCELSDLDGVLPAAAVIDPERPLSAEAFVEAYLPEELTGSRRGPLLRGLALVAVLSACAAAWRWTPLREWISVAELAALGRSLAESPLAPLIVLGGYVVAGLLLIPLNLVVLATAIVFGPLAGFLYAMGGALLSASVAYGIGHALGGGRVRRLAGPRINRVSRKLSQRGVLAVVLLRLVPVAPYSVVNLIAGASHIRLRDFLIGSLIGLAPGFAAITLFGAQLAQTLREPRWGRIGGLALLALILAVIALWVRRRWGGLRRLAALRHG